MLVLAIFIALTLSALNVAPAFADENTPPEPAPTEEVAEVTESVETEESDEVSEPVEVEVEEEATPPADAEPDSASEENSQSVAEIIETLPEDTTFVVVDENGEALPLASEEAATIIEVADPQWCPVGVTPGAATCSGLKDSFNGGSAATDLIAWLVANQPNKAGVIWIEAGYVGDLGTEGGPINLNGANYGTMANFALTINGGWTGTGTTLNPNTPSTFNVPFSIVNWTGAITINNIVIDGASGAGYDALGVYTDGNIVLNNVDVQNTTTEWGAYIYNGGGNGTVTVNDSTFNDNTGTNASGLEIYSNNTVTLKNVTATGNNLSGVYIDNSSATTPKAVTLNGANHFNYNGSDGLKIYSKGAITLSNATAMGNTGGSGAYLSNRFSSTVYSAVTIKGTNNFSENGWDGLRVYTYGAITISNITSNDNGSDPNRDAAYWFGNDINDPDDYDYDAFGKGAYLYNANWSLSGKPQPVTLTGTNTFNGNASNGLYLDSNGVVKINNLTANENGCDPLKDINPYGCAGAYISGAGVTITGYNFFVGNSNQGLEIYNAYVPSKSSSVGAITLSNLYAEGNGESGVWAVNFGNLPYNVTITGTNTFVDNLNGDGLFVWSNGVVTISNITANGNDSSGVQINNTSAATPKAVVITGTNTFNTNGSSGLSVYSYGAITTNNVTANFNAFGGVELDNCDWDTVTSCLSLSPQAVTMNGNNNTSDNGSDGVYIISRGAITINNLTSSYSNNRGAYLDNQYDNAVAGVTIKGYTVASYNDFYGVSIFSNGAVTLMNVTTNGNQSDGMYIDNNTNTAKPMNVTITGNNNFNGNGDNGLRISTYGTVLLNNLTANDNGDLISEHGVRIFNNGGTLARPITINGTNTFNGNSGSGLFAVSLGVIKVNNVMANSNGGTDGGVYLNNFSSNVFNQAISITGYGIFNNNTFDGLGIFSNGAITLANLTANFNGEQGAEIYNWNDISTTSAVNATITGVNTFNGNGAEGLFIQTDGAITLNNITANANVFQGVNLDNVTQANTGPTGIKALIINGVNMFNNNGGNGLEFNITGATTLTRITANYNNDLVGGAPLQSGVFGTAGGAITITCGTMYNNEGYGYNLTGTVVTLKGVFTYGNPSNNFASPMAVITRTCPLP